MNTQIILASHGSMAEGTASAVKMIAGEQPNVSAFGLDTWETPDAVREQVEQVIAAHPEEYAVILCDIKGGSVHNRLIDLCMRDQVAVVSGMNLALVLALVLSTDLDGDQVRRTVEEAKENLEYFDRQSFQNNASEEEEELW